jgi:hypothetical protein
MAGIDGKARFLETLQIAMERRQPVAIYADEDDFQSYEVGYVEYVDSQEVMLQCLTPKGEPDGRRAIHTDDISRIDTDNAYTRRLDLLFQYKESIFDKEFRPLPKGVRPDLRTQLENARESSTIVHVVDSNDYGPTGFVERVGEDFVELKRVGSNGEPDGMATVLTSSIHKVHFGRRQEQVLEFLYRYNHDLKKLLDS